MGQDILKGLKAKNIHSIIQKCVLFDRKLSKSSLCWNYFSGMDEHLVTDYITTELGTLFRNFCNKLHYKKLAMKLKALGKALVVELFFWVYGYSVHKNIIEQAIQKI